MGKNAVKKTEASPKSLKLGDLYCKIEYQKIRPGTIK